MFVLVEKTPVIPSMGDSERNLDGTNADKAVQDYLQTHLGDKFKRDFSITDFIKSAWGLDPQDIPKPEGGYKLDSDAVNAYIDNRYHKQMNIKTEKNAYVPLVKIFEGIIQQVVSASGVDDLNIANIVNMRDRVVDGLFAGFKPDFLWSWLPEDAKHSWLYTALCGELKKKVLEKFRFDSKVNLKKIAVRTPEYPHWLLAY